jgi:hypothetical protein
MTLQIEKVIIEGPAILEKLSGEMPYKRLVGKVTYFGYLPEEEDNNLINSLFLQLYLIVDSV